MVHRDSTAESAFCRSFTARIAVLFIVSGDLQEFLTRNALCSDSSITARHSSSGL